MSKVVAKKNFHSFIVIIKKPREKKIGFIGIYANQNEGLK